MSNANSTTRSLACRLCGRDTLRPFLDLGDMPIANAFLTDSQLHHPEYKFRLQAGFCEHCLMVQLIETVDPGKLFHDQYAYFSSISRVMDQHFERLAARIGDTLLYDDKLPVFEIGSNDGILLQKLDRFAPPAIGIEPSANVAAVAREKGLDVVGEFFTSELAANLVEERGHAQVVVGGNVLCHIPDLNGLARALATLLEAEGVFIFEDPYLLDILSNLAYDQIYDEHVYYFSVTSLSRLFARHGLRVFHVEPISVHGGSMRVFGCRANAVRPTEPSVQRQLAREAQAGLGELEAYEHFARRVAESRRSLVELLQTLRADGKRLVGYAASSKGTVILNYCGIGPDLLEYVCDNTPTKQGLYTPGTHIPIVPTDTFRADYPDYAFLLAWNHLREIMSKETAFANGGGRFITHAPTAHIV
ncbi:MAG: methyltransferase domain-containing protein, partial [Anaerolineales bacterium]